MHGCQVNVDNTKEFTCLSLCSGYGGIELGLKRAVPSLRTIAYVEVEAFAAANLVSKMEAGLLDAAPVWTDIKTFNPKPFRHKIHIITAGYPCQPFSFAGRRQGEKDPRHLWPDIERIIKAIRPVWFFGENVAGHLSFGFPKVYCGLHNLGYEVEAGLFTAAEVGAPHRRQRLFFLAHDSDCRFKNVQNKQRGQSASKLYAPVLANSECPESGQGIIEKASAKIRRSRFAISNTISDSGIKGLSRSEWPGTSGKEKTAFRSIAKFYKFPAVPGRPQYKWEEPRIVDNSDNRRLYGQSRRRAKFKSENRCKREPKPELGRAIDGNSCWVDRLRIIGNGVVPQVAEKAFRILLTKFDGHK